MRIGSFRVQNFRSIIDTGWLSLSSDNITALIGQNESGKSSIIDALRAFESNEIQEDDIRADGSLPTISISYSFNSNDDFSYLESYPTEIFTKKYNTHSRINISRKWSRNNEILSSNLFLEETKLSDLFPYTLPISNKNEEITTITASQFIEDFINYTTPISVFSEKDSILPNSINLKDIEDNKSIAPGRRAVTNWMKISSLNIKDLKNSNTRYVQRHLELANKKITDEFQKFWSQTVGKESKIEFDCQFKNHTSTSATPGEPYLEFWVVDDSERLYLKQRSQGVIWYLSFFLQLRAKSLDDNYEIPLILIDEPGANLHARAQSNVLALFEELKDNIHFLYSTHSPFLVDPSKLYRVLAVQRHDTGGNYSETRVFTAHQLGSANLDTLLPVFTAMGLDIHQNSTIPKYDNIILEEISAYYYIMGFYKLLSKKCSKFFLPAQGVSKVPILANLFLGWGLEFGVVIDGDSAGRKIYNELKRNLCFDDDSLSQKKLLKIESNGGIENLFSLEDFSKIVVPDVVIDISKTTNSERVKDNAKAIIAANFKMKIENGEIVKENFSKQSIDAISKLLESIEKLSN